MKYLVVGLGNPGAEYNHTRHNIGFDVLDHLAAKWGCSFADDRHGWLAQGSYRGRKVYLLKPSTYMNLSGKALNYWIKMLSIQASHVMVVTDDLSLPVGKIRIRPSGSDGGHNGLKSIQDQLGHQAYPRLRFGIGSDFPKGRQVEFVLGKWTEAEQALVNERMILATDAIETFVFQGVDAAMNGFNNK